MQRHPFVFRYSEIGWMYSVISNAIRLVSVNNDCYLDGYSKRAPFKTVLNIKMYSLRWFLFMQHSNFNCADPQSFFRKLNQNFPEYSVVNSKQFLKSKSKRIIWCSRKNREASFWTKNATAIQRPWKIIRLLRYKQYVYFHAIKYQIVQNT